MSRKTVSILIFGLLVSSFIFTSVYAKEDIPISCYVGDPSENRWVGEVAVSIIM